MSTVPASKEGEANELSHEDSNVDVAPKLVDMIKGAITVNDKIEKNVQTKEEDKSSGMGKAPLPPPATNVTKDAPMETVDIEEAKEAFIDPALRQVSSHDSVSYDSSIYIGENLASPNKV